MFENSAHLSASSNRYVHLMRNAYGKKNPQTTKYGAFVRTNPTFFKNSKIESTMRVRFLTMAFLLTAMLPLAGAAGSDWKLPR